MPIFMFLNSREEFTLHFADFAANFSSLAMAFAMLFCCAPMMFFCQYERRFTGINQIRCSSNSLSIVRSSPSMFRVFFEKLTVFIFKVCSIIVHVARALFVLSGQCQKQAEAVNRDISVDSLWKPVTCLHIAATVRVEAAFSGFFRKCFSHNPRQLWMKNSPAVLQSGTACARTDTTGRKRGLCGKTIGLTVLEKLSFKTEPYAAPLRSAQICSAILGALRPQNIAGFGRNPRPAPTSSAIPALTCSPFFIRKENVTCQTITLKMTVETVKTTHSTTIPEAAQAGSGPLLWWSPLSALSHLVRRVGAAAT